MRRPEQKELRAALVGGASVDGGGAASTDRGLRLSSHGLFGGGGGGTDLADSGGAGSPDDETQVLRLSSYLSPGSEPGGGLLRGRSDSTFSGGGLGAGGVEAGAQQAVFTGIAGPAGLGKSALACWLCHDILVRTAFRDGIFWLEFGRG